jgi:hypothetical protein
MAKIIILYQLQSERSLKSQHKWWDPLKNTQLLVAAKSLRIKWSKKPTKSSHFLQRETDKIINKARWLIP